MSDLLSRWRQSAKERGGFAHPLTIARRLLGAPFIAAGRGTAFVGAWIGWGLDEAKHHWEGWL
jgi:hypothetical protein